jgi:hypothetical protein
MPNPRVGLPADQSPDLISQIDQVLSQVGTVLASDSCDQRTPGQLSLLV